MSYNQWLTRPWTHVEPRAQGTHDVTTPSTPTTTPRRVGALPQCHPGLCGTLVGPGKDAHGTLMPDREGRRWPDVTSTRRPTTNDQRQQDTDKRQDKRACRKQVPTDTKNLTIRVISSGARSPPNQSDRWNLVVASGSSP